MRRKHKGGPSARCGREEASEDHRSPDELIQHVEERVRRRFGRNGLREQVVVARVGEEVLARLDQLVESGVFRSRSEAAAVLLREAIAARGKLFERISAKATEIAALKEGVRKMALSEFGEAAEAGSAPPAGTKDSA